MSVKDGKDYLYLIWKCSSNRRQYIVGQLSKNGQYEFCYCEEFNEAVKEGFSPLISFEDTNRVYKSQELFPAFSSRLPDVSFSKYICFNILRLANKYRVIRFFYRLTIPMQNILSI